jgi:hypothetical protein
MPWWTPRTWVAGEIVTAQIMNTQIRDDLAYLYLHNLLPSEGIVYYNGTTCPAGYTEVTAARGRILVSQPTGIGTTVRTALTDLGTITISSISDHLHTFTGSADSAGGHTHTFPTDTAAGTDPNYALTGQTPSGAVINQSAGAHSHSMTGSVGSAGVGSVDVTMPYIQYLVCKKT